ncbi:excalibur calcium-binding domain-containing protein [Bacillus sp. 37MA]|uniref:excalibur calcium-binding domain-containing protein n=1 Tax=Bacillus sp. 37MA TaxID=1132442 RepID=UPI0009E2DC40|nr:excalibur calcium-binding domain-containing protein [Bacillus sp. 37MA]
MSSCSAFIIVLWLQLNSLLNHSLSFQNCTELRKVYPAGVASDHPAYESQHDRDKDNWACES